MSIAQLLPLPPSPTADAPSCVSSARSFEGRALSPETANYLRATRRLAEAAKAMSPRVSILRTEVGQAQAAWVDAGCPDCPPETKGSAVVFACGGGR